MIDVLDDPGWRRIRRTACEVSVPRGWVETSADGSVAGDRHRLQIDRVLDGRVPVEHLMAHISVRSRQVLDLYEPADATGIVVPGAGPARWRVTSTVEDGDRYLLAELFAEGYDQHMWYVRVSALDTEFDPELALRILDSFQIHFLDSGEP